MRILLHTLGCKSNQSDSESLAERLTARGHQIVDSASPADALIVNTCTVTAVSDQKSRQSIRRLRRAYPEALLVVAGCMPRADTASIQLPEADLIAQDISGIDFLETLEAAMSGRTVTPITRQEQEAAPVSHTRYFLKIQDGCDNFCTYCIIPKARGQSRSIPPDMLRGLAIRRHSREIVLTGIEISSYGLDLNGLTLIDAVDAIHNAAPGARLRLGSLEPRTIAEQFLQKLRNYPVCPHFHLSLQSGCDRTLRRMGRRYDTERFAESVRLVRQYYPGCAVTTDLIVGFPGETEAAHAETIAFIRQCNFADMHIFPYSKRSGTPAAVLPEQLSRAEKQNRARQASNAAQEMSRSYRAAQQGKILPVYFETEREGFSKGTSDNYLDVEVQQTGLRGQILPVKITETDRELLRGDLAIHNNSQ